MLLYTALLLPVLHYCCNLQPENVLPSQVAHDVLAVVLLEVRNKQDRCGWGPVGTLKCTTRQDAAAQPRTEYNAGMSCW